jgi:hypothetical protein
MTSQQNKYQRKTTTRLGARIGSNRNVPFRRRLVAALRPQQRRSLMAPLIVLLIVIFSGSAVFYRIGHLPTGPVETKSASMPFPQSYLVFQNLAGGSPATSSTTTLVQTNGVVEKQFTSNYTDSTFDEYAGSIAPFSSGLLLSNQLSDGTSISVTKWSNLHADGSPSTGAPGLVGALNNIWNNSGTLDGNMFMVGTDTAYGVFVNSQSYNFQKINLDTGIVDTVAQISTLDGTSINNNEVQPKTMDANQTEISFVMNDVSVNGKAIASPSVVVYNIATGSFTATALPQSLSGVTPNSASQSPIQYTVTADGKLLAYQVGEQATVNGIRTTWFTTHVYNTQTGKDVATIGNSSINLGACNDSFYFSNDDKFLVTCGSTSVTENAIMEITNTTTGAVIKSFNEGSTSNYNISPIGWSGQDDLVYTTNATAQGQSFNAATETAHRIDLNSGDGYDFPTGLGELIMVIH